jgi:hypothetical protein
MPSTACLIASKVGLPLYLVPLRQKASDMLVTQLQLLPILLNSFCSSFLHFKLEKLWICRPKYIVARNYYLFKAAMKKKGFFI